MDQSISVDKYVSGYPEEVQLLMNQIREVIKSTVPGAEELISYGIPTYKIKKNLVHFGGFKTNIGFYPGALAIATFIDKLAEYKVSKGTVQFPLNKPLPFPLIKEITEFRLQEVLSKEKTKSLKTCSQGHQFYKSSDCPTCPICEGRRKPQHGFLAILTAPARRALENEGINSLEKLSQYTEADVLKLHGIGPSTIRKLKDALNNHGLSLKK